MIGRCPASARLAFSASILGLVCLAGAAEPLPAQPGGGPVFGVAEDASQFAADGGASIYASLHQLGMSTDRWALTFNGDPTVITNQSFLDKAVPAANTAGVTIVLSLYPAVSSTPDPSAFCTWVGNIARRYPTITNFIIGNEVNTTRFWSPQHTATNPNAGPDSYEAVLAQCYDTLKTINPAIQVIGMGLSPRAVDANSTAPLTFIRAVGAAYKASGRTTPIMDQLAVHPYPNPNSNPPSPPVVGYQNVNFYGIEQLDRVKQAVYDAFNGTAQPTTLNGLRLMVDELGYQTYETGNPLYTGVESSPVVSEAIQATDYALIVHLYSCDPAISTVLFFHLIDETNLNITSTSGGWQSGLEHPDGSPKPSFAAVQQAIAQGCIGPQVIWKPVSGPLTAMVVGIKYSSSAGHREIAVELKTDTPTSNTGSLVRGTQTVKLPVTWFLPAGDFILPVAEIPNTYAAGPATLRIAMSDDFGRSTTLNVNVVIPPLTGAQSPAPPTTTTSPTASVPTPPPPAPTTYTETVGGLAHTWTDYSNAGGTEGPSIASNQTVQIACKVTGFKVADGDTWWYRIASSPWNNEYLRFSRRLLQQWSDLGKPHWHPLRRPVRGGLRSRKPEPTAASQHNTPTILEYDLLRRGIDPSPGQHVHELSQRLRRRPTYRYRRNGAGVMQGLRPHDRQRQPRRLLVSHRLKPVGQQLLRARQHVPER